MPDGSRGTSVDYRSEDAAFPCPHDCVLVVSYASTFWIGLDRSDVSIRRDAAIDRRG